MSKSKNKKNVTEKQLAANRANAQNSTGGTTPAGKIRQKFNAVNHGAKAQHVVLPDEDPVEYRDHCLIFIRGYVPQDPLEFKLVCRIAEEEWRIERVVSVETNVYRTSVCRDDLASELLKFSMYESRIDREVCRIERRLFKLQDLRRNGQRVYIEENPKQPAQFQLMGLDSSMSAAEMIPKERFEGEAWQHHLQDVFLANAPVSDTENPLLQPGIALKKGETEDWLRQQGIGLFEPCAFVTPPTPDAESSTPESVAEQKPASPKARKQAKATPPDSRHQAHLDDIAMAINGPDPSEAASPNAEKMGSFVTFDNNASQKECIDNYKGTESIECTDNSAPMPQGGTGRRDGAKNPSSSEDQDPSSSDCNAPSGQGQMGSFVIFYNQLSQNAQNLADKIGAILPKEDAAPKNRGNNKKSGGDDTA